MEAERKSGAEKTRERKRKFLEKLS